MGRIIELSDEQLKIVQQALRTQVQKSEQLLEESIRLHGEIEESEISKKVFDGFCSLQNFEVDFINGRFDYEGSEKDDK